MKLRFLLLAGILLCFANFSQAQYFFKEHHDNRREHFDRKDRNYRDDRREDRYDRRNDRRYDRRDDWRRQDRVYAMSAQDFSQALSAISDASFSSTKLAISQSVINTNWLTVNQIRQVLNQFYFESDKLKFAKLAYYKCIDPESFYGVLNCFYFSSSKEEISRMMSNY